jgi:uncharacterized protein (TIGR02145 family)
MAENLKATKYNDGTTIPLVINNTDWISLSTPGYCWYYNDAETFKATYGALYNWYVVDAVTNGGKNVCPTGWHVPSDTEWTTLTTYLGGQSVAGGKLIEAGTTHWSIPNTGITGGTNETGFTALPSGNRLSDHYSNVGSYGLWWSSTEFSTTNAYGRFVGLSTSVRASGDSKIDGLSVRCIKD